MSSGPDTRDDQVFEVAGVAVDTRHWIDGRRVASPETFSVHSPIDGSHLAEIAAGGTDEVHAAVAAARRAFPAWAELGPEGRGEYLDRLARAIRDHNDELAAVETADNGSLLIGNLKNVMARGALNISHFADLARNLPPEVIEGSVHNEVVYQPSGVAALITPWNAPFMLSTWKVGPALAAGNTAVLKPPEWAPLTCSLLADLSAEAGLPPGVLNVVQGTGAQAGQPLVDHPDLARISFTGSTDTARTIGRAAAQTLTPVSFELGGKSPFVVCEDADLDSAARTIAHQFINAGQVCLAGTRILVHESVSAELYDRVASAVDRLPIGDPRDLATRIGPLITRRQFDRVSGFVERALECGARALMGGAPHPAGDLYYSPTILTDVEQSWEIVQKEVFGPVLVWQTWETDSEVVDLANDTHYGLAAMIYTTDPERADRLARRIVAGTVWVNCFFVRDLDAPFGGARDSGIGREGGRWSFDFYADVKNIATRRGDEERAR